MRNIMQERHTAVAKLAQSNWPWERCAVVNVSDVS